MAIAAAAVGRPGRLPGFCCRLNLPLQRVAGRCRRAKLVEVDRRTGTEGFQQAADLAVDAENRRRQIDAGRLGNVLAKGQLRRCEQLVVHAAEPFPASRFRGDFPLNLSQGLLQTDDDEVAARRHGDLTGRPAEEPLFEVGGSGSKPSAQPAVAEPAVGFGTAGKRAAVRLERFPAISGRAAG